MATAREQREELALRIDRIEEKIDKMSEAIVALARAEEKIATLTSFSKQQSEMVRQLSIRIDKLEETVLANSSTVVIINKAFWIIVAGAVTAITGMLLMQ